MDVQKTAVSGTTYRVLQVIWLALVVSVFIYVIVARFAVSNMDFAVSDVDGILFPILAGISVATLGIQLFFQKFIDDGRLFDRIHKIISKDHPAGDPYRDPLRQTLLQNHMAYGTILWAMGEASAIYGLFLTFLSGDIRYVIGFAVYAVLNLFFFRPQRQIFEDQLIRLRRFMETSRTI